MLYEIGASEGGHRLELRYGAWEEEQIVFDGQATIIYNGSDEYVWASARFRDVVRRR